MKVYNKSFSAVILSVLFFITGCSVFEPSTISSSIRVTNPAYSAARGGGSDGNMVESNYYLKAVFSGGYKNTEVFPVIIDEREFELRFNNLPYNSKVKLSLSLLNNDQRVLYNGESSFNTRDEIVKINLFPVPEEVDSDIAGDLISYTASDSVAGVVITIDPKHIIEACGLTDIYKIVISRKSSQGEDDGKKIEITAINDLSENRNISILDVNLTQGVEYSYETLVKSSSLETVSISGTATPLSANGELSFNKKLEFLDASKDIIFPPVVADLATLASGTAGSCTAWFTGGVMSIGNGVTPKAFFDINVVNNKTKENHTLQLYYQVDNLDYYSNLYVAALDAGLDLDGPYKFESVDSGFMYDLDDYVIKEYGKTLDADDAGLPNSSYDLNYPEITEGMPLLFQSDFSVGETAFEEGVPDYYLLQLINNEKTIDMAMYQIISKHSSSAATVVNGKVVITENYIGFPIINVLDELSFAIAELSLLCITEPSDILTGVGGQWVSFSENITLYSISKEENETTLTVLDVGGSSNQGISYKLDSDTSTQNYYNFCRTDNGKIENIQFLYLNGNLYMGHIF